MMQLLHFFDLSQQNIKVITRERRLRCRGEREDRVVKEKDMQEKKVNWK